MEPAPIISTPYEPHPRLRPYVTAFIFNRITIAQERSTVDLFPVGHSVLSFSMDNLPLYFRGAQVVSNYNITGQLTQHFKMDTGKGVYKTVMALLKPYGAYRFFATPQHPLVNRYEDLNQVHASFAGVDKTLGMLADGDEMVQHVEAWLLHLLDLSEETQKLQTVIGLCDRIISEQGNTNLTSLYSGYDLSKSTAERHFREMIGVTPKLFSRIIRFNQAYQTIISGAYQSWSDIVAEHGYFDQAHFIKEFKGFFGHTPSQLHQSVFNIAGHVSTVESEKK